METLHHINHPRAKDIENCLKHYGWVYFGVNKKTGKHLWRNPNRSAKGFSKSIEEEDYLVELILNLI